MKKRIDGVYAWKVNGVIRYVGSGKNITDSRKSNHLARLRKGKHCKGLQALYNELGESTFEFIVLEECAVKDLYVREKYYMELYKDTVLNENKIRQIYKKKRTGLKAREHKSQFRSMFSSVNNPNCHTNIEVIINIKMAISQGYRNKDIAAKFEKSEQYISAIKNGRRWKNVSVNNIVPIGILDTGSINIMA